MRVWVVKIGTEVPHLSEHSSNRLFREGQIEEGLRRRGHETLWFTASFHHRSKRHFDVPYDRVIRPNPAGPQMVFMKSLGYRHNFSFARLLDHYFVAKKWQRIAESLPKPDIIFCAYPTIELSYACVRFGQRHGIPVVIDIRDLWPDVIYDSLKSVPILGRLLSKRWFLYYEYMARYALANARGLTGVSAGVVKWGQAYSGRNPALYKNDRAHHQSQPDPFAPNAAPNIDDADDAHSFWSSRGISLAPKKTRIIWAGRFYPSIDDATLFAAYDMLPAPLRAQIELIICGEGVLQDRFDDFASRHDNVRCVGWAPHHAIIALMRRSDAALLNYVDRFDFKISLVNKIVDYTAADLPIITGINGEFLKLDKQGGAFLRYEVGKPETLKKVFEDLHRQVQDGTLPVGASRAIYDKYLDSAVVLPQLEAHLQTLVDGVSA